MRIYTHAFDEGWIKAGSVIVDPFGGIGSTGILGAYKGVRVVMVELESRFTVLAEENFKLHDNAWQKLGCPRPVMIQGDSRQLSAIIGQADCVVSSPPFLECLQSGKANSGVLAVGSESKYANVGLARDKHKNADYGLSPGQLGAMKAGSVEAVISSPPYAETLKGDGSQKETAVESWNKRSDKGQGGGLGQSQRTQGYGSPGNLGNLKAGNVDLICSSPPYEGSGLCERSGIKWDKANRPDRLKPSSKRHAVMGDNSTPLSYGNSGGQLGNSQGDTFWSAAKTIVEQCHKVLKPDGVAIWVVKDFVRNKKRVDFCGDWRQLCESVGFVTLHEHHASLVKETVHDTFFGEVTERKERKSFFRRLAEKKGSPAIDWEDVICCKKT